MTWRNPQESHPPLYERVLVVWDGNVHYAGVHIEMARYYPEGWKVEGLSYFCQPESIKFWQPLPPPPEALLHMTNLQKFALYYNIPEAIAALPADASIIQNVESDDGTTYIRTTIVLFSKVSDEGYWLIGKYRNDVLIDAWKLSDEYSLDAMVLHALE